MLQNKFLFFGNLQDTHTNCKQFEIGKGDG